MSKDKQSTSLVQQDYEAIQAAVMETERGRWFLSEYARRNRVADTDMLLDAIKKLEGVVSEKEAPASTNLNFDNMRFDIVDMANAIAQTKQQIAALRPEEKDDSRVEEATAELGAIVAATEVATSDILEAAEKIQEIAWTMREEGANEDGFNKLDECTTNIYTACSFQDITGQRTSKIVEVLGFLEGRILAMMKIWGIEGAQFDTFVDGGETRADSHLLNGPQLDGKGVEQDDVDLMMANEEDLFDAVVQTKDHMDEASDALGASIANAEITFNEEIEAAELTSTADVEVLDDLPIDSQPADTQSADIENIPDPCEKPQVSASDLENLSPTDKIALFT